MTPPSCITIQHCSDLGGTHVAAWDAKPPEGRVRIESPHHQDRALYAVGKIDGHTVKDFESLFSALWSVHKDDILEARFNRTKGGLSAKDWGFYAFDDPEREEIRKTLADPKNRTR
jgi:hypothetical protein